MRAGSRLSLRNRKSSGDKGDAAKTVLRQNLDPLVYLQNVQETKKKKKMERGQLREDEKERETQQANR